jgi:FkbM family methyltransferase
LTAMGTPATSLASPAPLAHRLAHKYCAAGWRGRTAVWFLANRFPWPAEPSVRVAGGELRLDARIWLERALYQSIYERTQLELVSRLIRPGDACVDVGANVGVYSVLDAARSRGGRVVAFEPSPTFQRLSENLRRYPSATALNLGLSDRPGRLPLSRAGTDDIGASFRDGTSRDPEVPVARLDEVPEVRALERVDFLRIDVEGWEPNVMAGASRLWQRRMVGMALIEANPQ